MQDGAHRLCLLLLVPVTGTASRLGRLAAVHAYHVTDKPSNKIGLQWYVPLREDILLLGHLLAVDTYHVAPLVAVVVTLVTLPVIAEAVHRIVVALSLNEYLLCPRPVVAALPDAALHAVCLLVFASDWDNPA